MKLVYTVCTTNHLYQALSLGDSLNQSNPDYKLVIGLVDKKPITDFEIPFEIVEIENINPENFSEMESKYSVTELTMACKPLFALYFLNKYPTLEKLIYFDTDILILNSIEVIENSLDTYDIMFNPHITKAVSLNESWNEKNVLNAGLYNTGFVGMRRSENTFEFLNWWKTHLFKYGYHDYCKGMGADQLCFNFVPVFFKKVLIDYHPAHNVAYWNFLERSIGYENGQYFVNDDINNALTFYHFSGYNPNKPKLISKHYPNQLKNTVLKQLYGEYNSMLIKNHFSFFSSIIPAYGKYTPPKKERGFLVQLIDKAAWKAINFIENY